MAVRLPADVRFVCSPSRRAHATAALALGGLCVAPELDARLADLGPDALEGLAGVDTDNLYPFILQSEDPLAWQYRAPKGEGFDAFRARIGIWLREQARPCVVVTHAMISGLSRGLVLGPDDSGIDALPGR